MTDLNEQFKEFAKLQADFFKPVREANGLIADSYEKFARLGYEIQGDLIEYTIEQTQLAAGAEDISGFMSKQYENAKSLNEKMTNRANQGSELAKEFFSSIQKVEVAPMFEAPAKATAKAAKTAKAA